MQAGQCPPAHVDDRWGKSLQLTNAIRIIDHVPVACSIPICALKYQGDEKRIKWDRDLLMHSIIFVTRRQEFFDALAKEIDKDQHKWNAVEDLQPDLIYPFVIDVVRNSAEAIFAKGSLLPEKVKQSKLDRQELLQPRRSIRLLHFQLGSIEELQRKLILSWQIVAKLRAADDIIKKHIQTERRQRQEALTWELCESWRSRRLAECRRACRSLAYASKGACRKWARLNRARDPRR